MLRRTLISIRFYLPEQDAAHHTRQKGPVYPHEKNTRMSKKCLIINAHPKADAFCDALAQQHARGLKDSGHDVREHNLRDLSFDPVFEGYDDDKALEPDLLMLQADMQWADHWVLVYPLWWGNVPGLLKGMLDRTLLPGFAFRFEKNRPLPRQLLKGKTARLMVTMDSPPPLYKYVYGQPGHRQMKSLVLGFCGVKTSAIENYGPLAFAGEKLRHAMLTRAYLSGRAGFRRDRLASAMAIPSGVAAAIKQTIQGSSKGTSES